MTTKNKFITDFGKIMTTAGIRMPAEKFLTTVITYALGFGLAMGLFLVQLSFVTAILGALLVIFLSLSIIIVSIQLSANKRIELLEDVLPDFLTLMSSNIRSGLTPDRALVISARKEFGPLTEEITHASKLVMTGTSFDDAFEQLGSKVKSEALSKSIRLIVEGIRAGGNLADLLENSSKDIRRFRYIRKEVGSNVMVYKLFLFAAAVFGAPLLYATATFLIEVVSDIKSKISIDTAAAEASGIPILGGSELSPELVFWFSIISIIITTFFASLSSGVISAGKESEGLKYYPLLVIGALAIYLGTKFILQAVFSTFFLV